MMVKTVFHNLLSQPQLGAAVLDTLLTLLLFLFLLPLAAAAVLGLGRLLIQRDLLIGLAKMAVLAVGLPTIVGGVAGGFWLYQTYPLAAWGLAALFLAGFAWAAGHEIRRNWSR